MNEDKINYGKIYDRNRRRQRIETCLIVGAAIAALLAIAWALFKVA